MHEENERKTFAEIWLRRRILGANFNPKQAGGGGGGSLQICKQNLIFHILIKFHGDDVIHTKIMADLSTGTSGISSVSYRNLQKKETAVILKRIDQLPQNLARVHNLVKGLLIEVIPVSNFSILPNVSIVFYCSYIVLLLFHL